MEMLTSILKHPLFLAIVAGLVTAILAPYIIERTKSKISRHEKIITTQFEVIETLTTLSFEYFIAAKFVVTDFSQGQTNSELLARHLHDYDRIAEQTLKGHLTQAYRARVYFGDPAVYETLQELSERVSYIDRDIIILLSRLEHTPKSDDEVAQSEWQRISNELDNFKLATERILEVLYRRTGEVPEKSVEASKIGTGKELPTR